MMKLLKRKPRTRRERQRYAAILQRKLHAANQQKKPPKRSPSTALRSIIKREVAKLRQRLQCIADACHTHISIDVLRTILEQSQAAQETLKVARGADIVQRAVGAVVRLQAKRLRQQERARRKKTPRTSVPRPCRRPKLVVRSHSKHAFPPRCPQLPRALQKAGLPDHIIVPPGFANRLARAMQPLNKKSGRETLILYAAGTYVGNGIIGDQLVDRAFTGGLVFEITVKWRWQGGRQLQEWKLTATRPVTILQTWNEPFILRRRDRLPRGLNMAVTNAVACYDPERMKLLHAPEPVITCTPTHFAGVHVA